MIAIHAAAAAAKAKSDALDAFRVKGATAPERACALHDLELSADNSTLRELFATGVLRGVDARGRELMAGELSGAGDRFYLDEVAFIAERDGTSGAARSRQLLVAAIGAGILILGLLVFFLSARSS